MLIPPQNQQFSIGFLNTRAVLNRGVFNRDVFNRGAFNRAVLNRGVFNRAVNLIDLEHSTQYVLHFITFVS